ncbi:MAG: 50S ribosomal protein L13, partial [Planctomycetota bacterium]
PADVVRQWHVVDADGLSLGRLAARTARVLMGKHRPDYTPHVDCGDFVVVVNCDKVKLTGNKEQDKVYYHYTGYPGGLRERKIAELREKDSGEIVKLATRRMLPKTRLGKQMLTKLKTFNGSEHNHQAQRPTPLVLQ